MGTKRSILLVTNRPSFSKLLERELSKSGLRFQARRVTTEGGFIRAAKKFPPAMILCDYDAPRLNCLAVLRLAQQLAPASGFLFISEDIDEEAAVACMKAGADDFLAHPYFNRLGAAVAAAMERRRILTEKERAEKALEQIGNKYLSLFEDSPVALLEADLSDVESYLDNLRGKGVEDFKRYFETHPRALRRCAELMRLLDANKTALKLVETRSKKRLLAGVEAIFTKETYPQFQEQLVALAKGYTAWESEITSRTFKGRMIHSNLRWSVAPGHEKTYSRILASLLDITQHRRAEEEIYRSKQMLQLVLDNIPQRIFWKDRNSVYAGCNKPFALDSGMSHPRQVVGKNDFELAWKKDAPRLREVDRDVMTTGNPKLSFEEPRIGLGGSVVWLRVSKVPLCDREGNITGVLGTYEDITEQKRADEALRASEEKYRRFFDEDLSGDFISTPDGRLLACNPTFVQIFGFQSVEEAMSTNLNELYPDPAARENYLDLLRRQKKLERHEMELRRKDGKQLYVVENAYGSFNERAELTEIKGYIFDDTNRKKLEEQLRQSQKMEAVGRLAGGVAHDFNNLLTCINGYSDLLLSMSPEAHPSYRYIREIRKAGERASLLTSQLLALSRQQLLQPKVLDLNGVVTDMEMMVRRLIGEDIDLRIFRGEGLGRIKVDPGQIGQIILNLAVNSRDAMPDGGCLTIQTANMELDNAFALSNAEVQPGPYVMLAVSDDGCGMSPEVQAHIFEPFFTTKEVGRGTGLGLPTVYGIVKQSEGHISVCSKEGQGTTIKVYFPRREEQPAHRAFSAALRKEAPATETVLLVEDDPGVLGLARKVLQAKGYRIIAAPEGSSALEICRQLDDGIDILITDVVMPLMGGRELARQVLAARPGVKVLFMSGYPQDTVLRQGRLEPGTAFLQKPFSAETLAQKVRTLLDAPDAVSLSAREA